MLLALNRSDGGVSFMRPIGENPDIETLIRQWEQSAGGVTVTSWHEISESEVPQDRAFRDAWKLTDSKVEIDMPKAIEIHKERLGRKAEAITRKQALLDSVKGDFSKAKTPEELKQIK